jgi:hypothetical protein
MRLLILTISLLGLLPSLQAQTNKCITGDCVNGNGSFMYSSGARYDGKFKAGRAHGVGTLVFKNKDIYKGDFIDGRREGRGEMKFNTGQIYNGQFVKGRMQGQGKMNYPNGDIYQGSFVDDLPHGTGIYTFASGAVYKGEIIGGKFEGSGRMSYGDGAFYEGEWSKNEKEGMGTYVDAAGRKQSGEWLNGKLAGQATSTASTKPAQSATTTVPASSGSTQNGSGKKLIDCNANDCLTGQGFFLYQDGSRWEGSFKAGYPNGKGILYYADGSRYEGYFADHAPHGEGIMYYENGRVFGAEWNYGTPVRELNSNQTMPTFEDSKPVLSPKVNVFAVIVGVGRYLSMPSLKYTDDDAYQLYAFLKSPEGGALPDNNIRVLIDDDATRSNILSALQTILNKADANDVVVFYFSGHGLPGSFLPVDYDGFNNKLTHDEVRKLLDKCQARHKVCIADACHSGSLLASRDVAAQAAAAQRLYDAFETSTGGTALIMSSKAEEYSLEDQGLRSGIFSHFMIKGLRGAADIDNNKIIDVTELYNYTSSQVRSYTQNVQNPVISGKFDARMPIAAVR